ncbi:MAG: 3'(2'),5'-bisphosphate nucleotidase CysQ [Rhizobiaceae bacterium]
MISRTELIQLVQDLLPVVRHAGDAIMEVHRAGFAAEQKSDGSPVTQADLRAEKIVVAGLKQHAQQIAIVSEENAISHKLAPADRYFLVDPLDGTREFVKTDGKGAFTVNIGLIENGQPVAGIVHAPALDTCYWGIVGHGAFLADKPIAVRMPPDSGLVALASRSHRDDKTNAWLVENGISETVSIGSSLKFCLMAKGEADVYPRFGPTMEWDTAAGHAVLAAAGGGVEHPDGRPFTYGKPEYRNGPFIAHGKRTG